MREGPDRKGTDAKKIRVLSVEDDALDRGLIRHALESDSQDFVMKEAADGDTFEKFLSEGGFDVVITDFNILGFEGLEVVRAVKERYPEVPVIVVTGTGSEEIAVRSLKEGAEDYIIKNPHHIAQLPHTILRVIEDVKTRNRLRERETSLRAIAENVADGIVLVDRRGCVVFSNQAAENLLCASPGGLIGTAFVYRFGTGAPMEIDLPCCDEGPKVAEMRVSKTVWEDEECFIVSMRDVTEHRRSQEEIFRTSESLKRALAGTVQAMSMTVEMRDPYTAGHQRRMADLAGAIAAEMGMDEEQVDFIRIAGSIHDIGKISVPSEILSKPAKLSETEFNLIKAHPQTGHDILKGIEFSLPIADIILHHHERLNGSGYPDGLKGDEIMPESRILAVADVVEAIASHRPYRATLGLEAALEEIDKNRGILYDPAVSDACLRLFREKGYLLVE